ncbi:pyridoxamine 5'-phosphate oxidase family protein [Candidatus Poribacteria bacterium]|nr:pyridoxamine 5'-phosphate oxidase family protein [Candidatus Poribacteria bacterium]
MLTDLFTSQRLAVLATHYKGQPYTSLVAFAATRDLKHLLFATKRNTRKYVNLTADARVALLIDDSANQTADFSNAIAVTAIGTAEEIEASERDRFIQLYLNKHRNLEEFVMSPECLLIKITVDTYYVSKFQDVTEFHIKD